MTLQTFIERHGLDEQFARTPTSSVIAQLPSGEWRLYANPEQTLWLGVESKTGSICAINGGRLARGVFFAAKMENYVGLATFV